MTDLKHTKGPWVAKKQPAGYIEVLSDSGDPICDVVVKNGKANSKLITAAPEMLDMLQRILNADFGWGGEVSENEVNQLIKGARGES